MVVWGEAEEVVGFKGRGHNPRRNRGGLVGGDSDLEGVFGVGLSHDHTGGGSRPSCSHRGPRLRRVVVDVSGAHADLATHVPGPRRSLHGGVS